MSAIKPISNKRKHWNELECSAERDSNIMDRDAILRGFLRYGLDPDPFHEEMNIRMVMNVFGFTLRDVKRCLPADIPLDLMPFVDAVSDDTDMNDFDHDTNVFTFMHMLNRTLLDLCRLLSPEWSSESINGHIISQPSCDMHVTLEDHTYLSKATYSQAEYDDIDAPSGEKLLDLIMKHADNPKSWILETLEIENGFQVAALKAPWGARALAVESSNRVERIIVFTTRKHKSQDRALRSSGALSMLGLAYKRARMASNSGGTSMYDWLKSATLKVEMIRFPPPVENQGAS